MMQKVYWNRYLTVIALNAIPYQIRATNAYRHTISNGHLLSDFCSRFFSSFPHGTCALSVIDDI